MSYQVLARKWRPKSFAQLVGQEHVVTVLTNALQQQRLHHAYLFTGTRGVGKTTIARIFAKSLNCLAGITAEPCGTCDACVDIDQGRFVDLLEIDAASRTKVDDTREILDNVQYAPTRGRYKVYLIDEVHMLSRSSFNALLKTLEEPPEHVKFILATTDPKKLPITVLSRCLQFHLKSLTIEQINLQLEYILQEEKVTSESGATRLLAKAARGSMRDSLSLTDQAIAQGQGHLAVANIQQMLGGVDQHWAYKILIALIKNDSKGLMSLSLDIASYAPSYSRLLAEIIQLLHQVALAQIVDAKFDLLPEHQELLAKFVKMMSPEDVQLYYQIALNGRKDLPYAMDEQAAFDMVLLRMLAFQPQKNLQSNAMQTNDAVVTDNSELDELELNETSQLPQQSNSQISERQDFHADGDDAAAKKDTQNLAAQMASIEAQAHQLKEQKPTSVTDSGEMTKATAPDTNDIQPYQVEATDDTAPQSQLSGSPQHVEHKGVIAQGNDSPPEPEESEQLVTEQATSGAQPPEPSISASQQSVDSSTFMHESEQHADTARNQALQDGLFSGQGNEPAEPVVTTPERPQEQSLSQNAIQDTEQHTTEPLPDSSPVAAVLASRNMLRSRKKALEKDEKKSSDAAKRQDNEVQPLEIPADVPSIETLPEQPYEPEIIDPAVITKANQIDKWANMIDSMSLGGRLRQLAIHSTISAQSTDDYLLLELDQSTKHLQSDAAHKQLETHLCQLLNRQISVDIKVVESTKDDPFQIQTDINEKRFDYAKELILADDIVNRLQQEFDATIDESTIAAR